MTDIQKASTKQQIAYEAIRNKIVNFEIKPGTMLSERQLCQQLNLSRTPIREALRRLVAEGFLELMPGIGVFVSKTGFQDMIEIFELREALEKMAVKLFMQRKTNEALRRLKECIAMQKKAFNEADHKLFMEKDLEFHNIIIQSAHNSRIEEFLKTIRDQIKMLAFSGRDDDELLCFSMRQHLDIMDAIENNDVEKAEASIAGHILRVKDYHYSKHYLLNEK